MRLMRKYLIGAVFLALLAGSLSCSNTPKGPVVATFDGGSVSAFDFKLAVENLPKRVRGVAERQRKEFLESYITEKLLLQEAEKRGLQHMQDVQDVLKQARQKILVAKLIESEVEAKAAVTPEDIQAYYDSHQDEFMSPYRVRASHILLRSREEAVQALARIKGGESFEDVAKQVSLDPTAAKGGDLGFFQKGQLIAEIEEAAFALSPGELSDVIQTSFGYHIIKVAEVSEPKLKDAESVKEEIKEKLTVEKKAGLFSELAERLKRKAKISIDEAKLSEVPLSPAAVEKAK